LGSIRLNNAQIGRQMPGSSHVTEEYNSVYRHAFLIVEQKRVGSAHYVRHILCANSDDDRDDWVHALLQNIQVEDDNIALNKSSSTSTNSSQKKFTSSSSNSNKKDEKPRKLSKGEIRAISATPISHLKLDHVGNANMEKLTSVPTITTTPLSPVAGGCDENSIGMAVSNNKQQYSRPTPSISCDSTDSTAISSSLPSAQTWSSYNDSIIRTSLDQQQRSNQLHAPRPAIVRRSSMGNLTTETEDQLNPHQYPPRRAISPTISSSSSTLLAVDDQQPTITIEEAHTTTTSSNSSNKKKAHRMTFWGKKMLFNSGTADQNEANNTPPRPSQSSSATTSNSTINNETMSRSTTTSSATSNSGGLRGFLSRTSHEQNDRSRKYKEEEMPTAKRAKQVFGVSLEEAVRICRVSEGYELPAVVYRCIEYLDAMDAVLEEGLYRLSGSNSTMKALKEKFNQEGDVNLLAAKDDYDVHVVAGLLKMWLRELPTSVLTREHRMDFLHVIGRCS
jgi:RalA-binding protein 1